MSLLALSCAVLAAAPLVVDADRHAVTMTVVSSDCGLDAPLEFFIAGPASDRAYESMFLSVASPGEIADAFEKAGIPAGCPYDPSVYAFWPAGAELEIEPPLSTFVREMRKEAIPSVVYTGGTRGKDGRPDAATNMPQSVFAFYNCAQSLMLFNDSLEQGVAYGRFQPAVKIPKGEARTVTFRWKGSKGFTPLTASFRPGGARETLQRLKEASAGGELVVRTDFSPDLTLSEATECASALAVLDSVSVKMNGAADGQFFFRAFLPLERWREAKGRLSQPPEIHFGTNGTFRVVRIHEDWSDPDTLEPKLTPESTDFSSVDDAARFASSLVGRTQTMILFGPPDMKLGRFYDFKKRVSVPVANYYLYATR